ncbi:MAG: double-strand break repair protein AddB [Alphaproteobacteria bacterium]|nr:double-strand break repair protein AddB [Alphaproteobacteria bacterium]
MPASASFLDGLAAGLIEITGARDNPENLAEALVFTPNRRAARELAAALYNAIKETLLVPRIQALGDIDEGDVAAAFASDELALPPALPAARRRGALARLIQHWREVSGEPDLPPASALAAADELASLLDQASIGDAADWSALEDLSLSDSLAAHWRLSQQFLDIAVKAWPDYLREQSSVDELQRERIAAEATAERWSGPKAPRHPVIIAGSTGATAATRILMKAALALPRGMVVLPGLDPDLDAAGWQAIAEAPSHPQYALFQTLRYLEISPQDVRTWPQAIEKDNAQARRRLVNEALAPASATKGWNARLQRLAQPGDAADLVTHGLAGLHLIEADDEAEEALTAAVLLREVLETPGKTAALVTPEAAIGRRVSALLKRWGVEAGASAGEPFSRTRSGSFLLLVMRWVLDPADPVMLLAVLKHELCAVGREGRDLLDRVSRLERNALRGPRLDSTLAQLADRITKGRRRKENHPPSGNPDQAGEDAGWIARPDPEGARLIADLDRLVAPSAAALSADPLDGANAAMVCAELAQSIAAGPKSAGGDRVWAGKSGAMAKQFVEQLHELCREMGPVARSLWPDFAESVAASMAAAPETPEHPRLAIWGPLEARLQRRDRMILAGLNEGAWPKATPADAFLNRSLRKRIGLPDPDERIGLSAHDFAQMANAPEVFLLRARRVDDKPSVASRWLWRLRTLAAGGLGDRSKAEAALKPGHDLDALSWARMLRRVEARVDAKPPAPRPAVNQRDLSRMSPSRAVDLIRDPYADFGKRILKLERLRAVGEEIDARERGTAVHKAVEIYATDRSRPLDQLIIDQLKASGASPELIQLESPLWLRAANAWLRWADARAAKVAGIALEETSTITFTVSGIEVALSATADRVELLKDGTLAIIDFKTGQPKSAKQVLLGLEPQLALEAAIGERVGFGSLGARPASELIYFQMSTSAATDGEKNGLPLDFKDADKNPIPTTEVAGQALEGLVRLVGKFASADQPYLSKPRVFSVKIFSDYDRLARRGEWTVEEGEE